MHTKTIINSFNKQSKIELRNDFEIPKDFLETLKKQNKNRQPGGETYALKYLKSFLKKYSKIIFLIYQNLKRAEPPAVDYLHIYRGVI